MSAPVIDFHIHPPAGKDYKPWVLEWMKGAIGEDPRAYIQRLESPERFAAFLHESGVDYGVLLAEQSPVTTGVLTNDAVAAFCRGRDDLIAFGSVNPALVADPGAEAERCLRDLGCRGLKLYPTYQSFYANDRRVYPVYAVAEHYNAPVLVHTGSSVFKGSRLKYGEPLLLDDVAVDFPRLTIVMAHSGRGFWYDQAFFLARLHENVYMEVAGLPPRNLLKYFPELERNADKVIFGSDWPGMPNIAANIAAIRSLPLREETKEKILGGNAARILGLTR
jgi:predicted TIM-barrel fold metal-dependent hydrolase